MYCRLLAVCALNSKQKPRQQNSQVAVYDFILIDERRKEYITTFVNFKINNISTKDLYNLVYQRVYTSLNVFFKDLFNIKVQKASFGWSI